MSKDNGGFVYPIRDGEVGITRRDWLAGLAMQAIITNYEDWYVDWPEEKGGPDVASESYRMADLLIAEGKK